MLKERKIKCNRQLIFSILFFVTAIFTICDPAFSVSTYHPKIMVAITAIYFAYCLYADWKEDEEKLKERGKTLFRAGKWLIIAIALYYIWDLFTIIYTKSYPHALSKLPYLLQYTLLTIMGIYFCDTKKKVLCLLTAIGLSGTFVSIGSYFYYFCSRNPIYFQRLSTARDYNVFACLILVCFIVLAEVIMHYPTWSYGKKIGIFALAAVLNIPAFYFAGSRRMFIILPYLLAFAILFEGVRLLAKKTGGKALAQTLSFFVILVAIYFSCVALLPAFTKLGTQKETDYKNYLTSMIEKGEEVKEKPKPSNEKTIAKVLETIEDKSMYGKRSIIYKVAFNELKTYSPLELAFGRGASYDIHMYDITTDAELLEAYHIDADNPRRSGWLWAHNFLLADLLNGGIIKVVLSLFLVSQCICYCVRAIKKEGRSGVLLVIPLSLVFVNNFISGAYGMLNDLFFHVVLMMLFGILYVWNKKAEITDE